MLPSKQQLRLLACMGHVHLLSRPYFRISNSPFSRTCNAGPVLKG